MVEDRDWRCESILKPDWANFPARTNKQRDWLATNTDDVAIQSHSLFPCSRERLQKTQHYGAQW